MLEISKFLKRETKEFRRKTLTLDQNMKDEKFEKTKKKLQAKFNEWITDLEKYLSNKRYRQVLREIEEKRNLYNILASTEFWKLKILKAKSILKIIERKMQVHSKEIILENSSQNFSLKFWFNQIFLTLEELILEFRFDLNPHMDPNSLYVIKSVQTIAEAFLEFIKYLSIFSIKIGEYMPLLAYISIADKFMKYLNVLINENIYDSLENIYLIKIKLLLQNCSFIPALDNLQIFFKLFAKNIILYIDSDTPINSQMLNSKEKDDKKRNFGLCNQINKIIMAYYLRGVISENLGFYKNSIKAYQQCRWLSNIFMYNYNKHEYKYFKNMERIYIVYNSIFKDIDNQFEIKNKEKEMKLKMKSHRILYKKKDLSNLLNNNNNKLKKVSSSIGNYSRNRKAKNLFGLKRNKSMYERLNDKKLVKALDKIGYKLYKEEQNRNNSVFNKFGTNQYVLSTLSMVNDLLSKPFRDVLTKMDKVEITKPDEDIKYLIEKTINIKKRNEFKEMFTKINTVNNKANSKIQNFLRQRIKSANFDVNTSQSMNYFNISAQPRYILSSKAPLNEGNSVKNNRYETFSPNIIKTKNCSSMKHSLPKSQVNIKTNNYNKIFQYSPDKNVFSKKMLNKKSYLDSYYGKELIFQKKLLKLKSYDMDWIKTEEYNHQSVIKAADQDFKIIKCFAETKNAKKNLINLVRENDLKNWEYMIKNKFRSRTTRKMNILNVNSINNFMKIHHINQKRPEYNPDDAEKNNDEKEKKLMMECLKLEEMENKCKQQKEILRHKSFGIKPKIYNNYNC